MQQQSQDHAKVPVQVQQAAEARQMGEPLAVYPRNHKVYPIVIASAFVAGAALLFIILFFSIPLPSTLLAWLFYLLALLLPGIIVYALQKRAGYVRRHDQLALYSGGFIHLEKRRAKVYRWEDIRYVLRGGVTSEGAASGDIDIVRLALIPKGRFKLSTAWKKHARAAFCDNVERYFVEARMPQATSEYEAGVELAFSTSSDGLSMSTAGFRESNDLLPWTLVESAIVSSDYVIIRKQGRTSNWYSAHVSVVPNAALLKALLDYRQYHSTS